MKDVRHWPHKRLSEVCESIVDCVNKTAPIVDTETPYKMIRTTNVKGGRIDLTTVNYVSADTFQRWTRRQILKRGDVILTREAPLGEVGLLRESDGVFLGQRLVCYRANPKFLDNSFLLYSMQGSEMQNQIKSFGSGSTVEHMRVPDAERLMIALPSLQIQRRIGGILSAYDNLIENNLRRIKILEEMAWLVYREWFVKFLFPGHENVPMVDSSLGMIPKCWEIKKLGDVLQLNYGKALKKGDRQEGPIPVFGSSGIVGHHDRRLVQGPGIIVGRKGNVGSVFWSDLDFYVIDTAYYVTASVPLRFLFYNLQGKNFINSDAAVPGLSRHQAYTLETIVPTPELLSRFCIIADKFEALASTLRSKNENLGKTRDLLLPRLISGQLDLSQMEKSTQS